MNKNIPISRFQFFGALLGIQAGARYFTLPREVGQVAGNDAWLSVLLAGMLIMGITLMMVYTASLFPGETITMYSRRVLGNIGGLLFNYLLGITILGLILLQFRGFVGTIKVFMLPNTPILAIGLVFVLGALFLVQQGFLAIMRFIELLLLPMTIIYFLITILCFQQADPSEVKPFLYNGILPVIKGIVPALGCTGPELIAGFLYVHVRPERHAMRIAALAGAVSLFRMLLLMLTAIMSLGAHEISHLVFPGITVFKTIDLPALLITEKAEAIVMSIIIPIAFIVLVEALYFSGRCVQDTIHTRIAAKIPYILTAVVAGTCLVPLDAIELEQIVKVFHWHTVFFSLGVLPAFTLLARLRVN